MAIVDFNIHLPPAPSLEEERDVRLIDLPARFLDLETSCQAVGAARGNLMILDTAFLRRDPRAMLASVNRTRFAVTVMVDPREPDAEKLVADHADLIDGVKFHPYLLDLVDADFPRAVAVSAEAARHGLWTAVDCSYGTLRLYEVSGVRLVIALARSINGPLVALHGGGPRVLDLLGVALETPHLYLDLSFSIPYWLGSSVETDYAFAIRKLGPSRWLFGSDHPYVPMEAATAATLGFLDRHGFTAAETDLVMRGTAERLLERAL